MMYEEQKQFLSKLLTVSCPSGSEEQVIDLFRDSVSSYVDEISTDAMGNCIAHKKGEGPKVMITAHADEIGLMVHYIDEKGFLYFKEIGGVDTALLMGRKVLVHGNDGSVIGVIGKKPIHLQDKKNPSLEINPEDLWIDIAARDGNEARAKVSIGSIATILADVSYLSNTVVASKALDDRIGIFVLTEIARQLNAIKADVYLVATVQEELGARGAQVAAETIKPSIGIAIDVTHATDYPTSNAVHDGDIQVGKGVVISNGPNMDKTLTSKIKKIADEAKIPYQMEAIARPTGTDARMIQVSGTGVKTGLLSIPCRYMHTPNEVVSLDDADACIRLLVKYLHRVN
ncbi:M42 family metallopeptidase [Parabacteroides distasonis]|uniref:M42 family metallopeptidase n=1 Tax=Parabacteroides distasonis TaxID=823 RepID=UPI00189A34ED|nr:M42 family metallopeptidase [Parabacteroides distasonis]MDB8995956.1 M42 family metallopeptidase [Parabacteroides distasonis]MDB9071126.1 M42 family metallopeptidase [Parabacteroides distasonis]